MLASREVTMKKTRIFLALALAAAFAAAPASAGPPRHGGHYHGGGARVVFGFNLGVPLGYPYAYPYYPYRYYPVYGAYPYPAPVIVQQQPSVYVEQPQVQPSSPPAGYWYYCADARAYYPYVRECPAGWERVAPQPQN
jgi:hypothetical protein